MEAWRLTVDPWKVKRTVVADLHHFVEEPDSDTDQIKVPDPGPIPHQSEKTDTDHHQS
jgi:hypothetical protein